MRQNPILGRDETSTDQALTYPVIVHFPDDDPHQMNGQVRMGQILLYEVETPPNSQSSEPSNETKEEGTGPRQYVTKTSEGG